MHRATESSQPPTHPLMASKRPWALPVRQTQRLERFPLLGQVSTTTLFTASFCSQIIPRPATDVVTTLLRDEAVLLLSHYSTRRGATIVYLQQSGWGVGVVEGSIYKAAVGGKIFSYLRKPR
ncbi:hypothetical protein CLAIMM_07577 [Cladophialophora immunda]|nr:hypothetical protein CLAIMM_07577 [Cladophialophora immunda]